MPASADTLGRTFGRVAEAYERTRPEYPAAAVERAAHELGIARDANVLDLAAGTGKLTRLLRTVFEHVIAVEPDDAMLAYIGGDARAGTAEAIPLDDRSVDAVFVGDAFHWFDKPRALAEIERVLRPGGGLALLWNRWGDDIWRPPLHPAFRADLDAVWARFHPPDRVWPDFRDDLARSAFGPLGEAQFVQSIRMRGRDAVDLWLTGSTPASIGDDERAAIAERAYPLAGSEYELRMPSDLHWASLR